MAQVSFNDVILTLFHGPVRFDREVYEKLVGCLYDHYEGQERQAKQYKFTAASGSSCVVSANQTRFTEFFHGESPEAITDRVQTVVGLLGEALGVNGFRAYDIQMSALVLQKDVGQSGKINYLSSEEFITNTFLQELDTSPLGGTMTGAGLRFLFRDEEAAAYDLRIEPYFKDKRYLFLDLAIQYNQPVPELGRVARLLDNALGFMSKNVLAFVRHETWAE